MDVEQPASSNSFMACSKPDRCKEMAFQTSTTTKSRIKLGRHQEPMAAADIDQSLSKIESAVHEIHNKNAAQLSFEELYRSAYNLVLQKKGEVLYERVKETLERHFIKERDKLKSTADSALLEVLAGVWNDHVRSVILIKDVLMYLDRGWVSPSGKLSVYDQSNALFLSTIIRDPMLSERIIRIALSDIAKYRMGELVDLMAIQSLYRMLQILGDRSRNVVEELFEQPFLKATEDHYARTSNEVLVNSAAPVYLAFADGKLKDEHKLAQTVFPPLGSKLNKVLQRELVLKHAMTVTQMPTSGLIVMVKEDKIDDLRLLFQLLDESMSPALIESARILGEYIASNGLSIIQAPFASGEATAGDGGEIAGATSGIGMSVSQVAVSVVTSLMGEKTKYETIVRSSFKNHKLFQKAVKDGFESCMNKDARCAQYLSIYADELLSGKLSESKENVEPLLDRITGLFRFLADKDVFESHYAQQLAKRLLNSRSFSQDAEKTMIVKLKSECGNQFTNKLEGMFKDMALSVDSSQKFRESLLERQAEQRPIIDFSAYVLSAGAWPKSIHYQEEASVRLPGDMAQVKQNFETFYIGSHTGRRIMWNYNLGSCEVKVTGFAEGVTHEFTVSPLQAIAMCTFNNGRLRLTFRELLEQTGIPREDLKRHMISMAVPKFQIFNKSGPKKEFLDEDVYEFNTQYKSKLRKVKINLVSMSGISGSGGVVSAGARSGSEQFDPSVVPDSVNEQRRHLMDAAIVRIMKSRKRLDHNNLLTEVLKHLRFKPVPQEIKKRIESLIERDYLERDENDQRFYLYLA